MENSFLNYSFSYSPDILVKHASGHEAPRMTGVRRTGQLDSVFPGGSQGSKDFSLCVFSEMTLSSLTALIFL